MWIFVGQVVPKVLRLHHCIGIRMCEISKDGSWSGPFAELISYILYKSEGWAHGKSMNKYENVGLAVKHAVFHFQVLCPKVMKGIQVKVDGKNERHVGERGAAEQRDNDEMGMWCEGSEEDLDVSLGFVAGERCSLGGKVLGEDFPA